VSRVTRHPRTPTLLIALLALVIALSGTTMAGYAAGKASGNKLIKKHSLSGNRLKPDTVTGAQVAESSLGTVPRAAVADALTPGRLTALTPVSPFTSSGARPLGFRKDAAGFVHLQGQATAGSITVVPIVQLPPGARPSGDIAVGVTTASGALEPGRLTIKSNGDVLLRDGNLIQISFEGVTFFADQ